jgi:polysaccharide deacetylase 2 family uncharacterized protein YibQ
MGCRSVFTIVLFLFCNVQAIAEQPISVAVIIDDVGINRENGERAIQLPGSVTYAFLPYGRHSISLANLANENGKEVILHMPMENIMARPIDPGGLTHYLNEEDFKFVLNRAIDRIPHIRGISNHMGSYLTQQPEQMSWMMDELERRDIYFIDSRTTPNSLAATIAKEKHIPQTSRDVFLDNTKTVIEIDRAFQALLNRARKSGSAIGVAHPHDVTLAYLETALPKLNSQSIRLIPASDVVALRMMQRNQASLVESRSDESGTLGSE